MRRPQTSLTLRAFVSCHQCNHVRLTYAFVCPVVLHACVDSGIVRQSSYYWASLRGLVGCESHAIEAHRSFRSRATLRVLSSPCFLGTSGGSLGTGREAELNKPIITGCITVNS